MPLHLPKILGGGKKKETPEDLRACVYRRLEEVQRSKRELERVWFLSLAFKEGSQWSSYDAAGRYLYLKPLDAGRVRLTANRLHSHIMTFIAKLTKNSPAWFVVPASSEPDDEDAAKLAEYLFEYLWQELRIKRKTVEATDWVATCGKAFFHPYWDARAGDPIADEDGNVTAEGNIAVEVVSPFEIYPDPLATSIADCRWLIRARTVYKCWVVDAYDMTEDQTAKIEEDVDASSWYRRSLGSIQGPVNRMAPDPQGGTSGTWETSEDLVTLVEYFEKKSAKHPFGRYVVYGGKVELKNEALPFEHGEMPFVEFGLPAVGKFWPVSPTEMSVPIQKELNRTRSQMLENQNMSANPKWIVEKDSLDDEVITSRVGEVLQVKRSASREPHPVGMPGLPAYVSENVALAIADLQEIWGQHEVTRATVPSGLRSGRAIAFLIEQDDTRLGPVVHALESAMEELGKQLLALARQFYKEPRLVRIVGKDKEMIVRSVRGTDIADNLTVRVQSGSAFPYSRAAKQDEIMELIQGGVFNPIQDREHILRALDVGQVDALVYRSQQDRNNARWENDLMAQGKVQVPADFDDHAVHIDEHNVYRKSPDYRELPVNLRDIFDQHVSDHQQYALGQIQATQAIQTPPATQPPQAMPTMGMSDAMGMEPASSLPETMVPETIQEVIGPDANA